MKVLDAKSALQPGGQVWMVADLDRSAWSRRIDWYLNFQLLRSEPHRSSEISPELKTVMETWGVEPVPLKVAGAAPLMVASHERLPNRATVMLAFDDVSNWAKACHKVWLGLASPPFRVFLPAGVSAESFKKAWPAENSSIELVCEPV